MKIYPNLKNGLRLTYAVVCMLLFTFSPLNVSAQPDEEGDGVDLGFTEPQDNGLDFSYDHLPTVEKNVVVLYKTFAEVYVKLKGGSEIGTTPIQYTVSDQPNVFVSSDVPVDGKVIGNLPLDKDITIYSYDINNVRKKIGDISTRRYDQDVIPLDMELYYPITNWFQDGGPGEGDLYDLVAGLPGVHYLQKSYFIQQFFHGGNPLPDADAGDVPDKPGTTEGGGCLCRPLQLTVIASATPIGGEQWISSTDGNYLPDFVPGQNTTQHFGNNDRGKRWYAYSYEGAAKYQQVWIETRRCVGGNNKMQMDNLSSNGPGTAAGPAAGNTAMISYMFACIGVDDFRPEDCPCERERKATVCWKYAAQANVSVDLRSGWCWNGRGVWGGATDVVSVMKGYSDEPPSSMSMPIDGNVITAGAGCDMNFDEAKLAVNLFKTVLYGYKLIKNLGISDPSFSEQLWGVAYGYAAADALKNLFSDDYVETNGSCGDNVDPGGTLVEDCTVLDLKVNRRAVVALVSNSKLIVEGYGKYKGNARILSSHAISGTVQRSSPDQSGENCCSNGHGAYSLSSFYSGMNTASAQDWVRGKFIEAGFQSIPGMNLTINGEFGYRGGGEREDCKLVIVDDREDQGGGDRSISQQQKLTVQENAIWLNAQSAEQKWQFSVVDVNGKVIFTSNGSANGIMLFDFGRNNISNGIYFVQLVDESGVSSLKLAKSN